MQTFTVRAYYYEAKNKDNVIIKKKQIQAETLGEALGNSFPEASECPDGFIFLNHNAE